MLLLTIAVVAILALAMAVPIHIEVIGRDAGMNVVKLDGVREKITDEELQHIRDTGERLAVKQDPVTPTNAIDKLADLDARVSAVEKRLTDADALSEEQGKDAPSVADLVKRVEAVEKSTALKTLADAVKALEAKVAKLLEKPAPAPKDQKPKS